MNFEKYAAFRPENWTDYEHNPNVRYVAEDGMSTAIGDPQVLLPGDFDDKWHLFCQGFRNDDYKPKLFHFVSEDGLKWDLLRAQPMNIGPVYLFRDGSRWILYRTLHGSGRLTSDGKKIATLVDAVVSDDLEHWSEPVIIAVPEFQWEKECDWEISPCIQLRNPCVLRLSDGRYRLYYSAGTVYLHDCGYEEPKYIGYAESDSPLGPFIKCDRPVIWPKIYNKHRNYGAGAIKVYGVEESFLAVYNSIYVDEDGVSRSALNLLLSNDGVNFTEADFNPFISPSGSGWKSNLVYQLDLVRWGDEYRIYYNARQGSREGAETIGMSILKSPDLHIRKLI